MRLRRKRKNHWPPLELFEDQILGWIDAYRALKGSWPTWRSGVIHGNWSDKWSAINNALQKGSRGLPGGSSLPRLLAAKRGVRNRKGLLHLTIAHILRWADAFRKSTGNWPHHKSKPRIIPGSNGETWLEVDCALRAGTRGLPGGSSLPRVLAKYRKVRNSRDLPLLTVPQILAWADAFHARTGEWPKQKHWRKEIPGSNEETWGNVIQCMVKGLRGLPGGSTLFELLAEHRGVRNVGNLPSLTVKQILAWADAFFKATGEWPTCRCEPQTIPGSAGEGWFNVDQVLRKGFRGLPGGSSLAKILAQHRDVPNLKTSMKDRLSRSQS